MRLNDNIEGHDDIVASLKLMEKRMDELETSFNVKMDLMIKNQDSLIKNQSESMLKVDRLYDPLIGTPPTNNEGLLADIKHFKEQTNKKITDLEKYVEKIKTFMWFLGAVCTIAGFFGQMLWQYILKKQ